MINKKGQTGGGSMGTAIIVALFLFIVGLMSVNFLTTEVTNARLAVTGLDCANVAGISDGNKLTCLAVDLVVPYFIILVFSAAGGYITAKFLI
jgi:hypothetical protein